MPSSTAWNALVPDANRLSSQNCGSRSPANTKPTHIVIHVTGTNSFADVRKTFMSPNGVSAHYLVGRGGELYQFVPDRGRAWHAGIEKSVRTLYRKGAATWQRYLRYFSWFKGYPKDAVYLGGDLNPVWDKTEAVFVAQASGAPWPHYSYFTTRWPSLDMPINFDIDPDPNNYSIGIETLGVGATTADPAVYPSAMYSSLRTLVMDLSKRYKIPMKKGRIVGHEDVNPVARFGWDPAPGFDWASVYQ